MRVLVLGAGVSGAAASRLLERTGVDHVVYDRSPEALAGGPGASGVETLCGEWEAGNLAGIDLVVASPGFSPHSAPLTAARAAGIPIWSEVELAVRHLGCPVIAVTGTNGKTTVVEQATAMLVESGIRAVASGNIGLAVSDVASGDWEVAVVEVSSFQLAYSYSLAPRVAVVVNVVADHLDWHGSVAAYRAAKARIARHLTGDDLLVYEASDRGAAALAAGAPGRKAPIVDSGLERRSLVIPYGRVILEVAPNLDRTYRSDLAAAAVAAMEMGAGTAAVAAVVDRFRPRRHRRNVVGEWGGVTWVDDSKATNPHAALAAIRSYGSVILIAGGRNKGLDLAPLAAASNVRYLVAIGESGPELMREARGRPATLAGSMDEAVALAGKRAAEGDTVLLAPGCASFDMFASYKERGSVFGRSVRRHMERAGARR